MYQKVLVPLDGSALAECALPHVKSMVKDGAAGEVIVITVADVHIPYDDFRKGFDFIAYRDAQLDKSRKYLDEVQSRLHGEGINVKTKIIEGNRPAQVIADFSQQEGVDLIVIATHGYTGVKKMLLGSVAFKVLHESHVPVLLVRPGATEKGR